MDENTLKIIHELSAKTDMIIWIMSGGFTVFFSLMIIMWSHFNKRFDYIIADTNIRFDKIDQKFDKIDQKFDKIDQKFEKVDQKFEKLIDEVKDIDRRLCRMEGSLSNKECCILKDDRLKQKAE